MYIDISKPFREYCFIVASVLCVLFLSRQELVYDYHGTSHDITIHWGQLWRVICYRKIFNVSPIRVLIINRTSNTI